MTIPFPALLVEVSPPRGIATEPLLHRLALLRGRVDAVNLTDNALGRVKLSALVLGLLVKQRLGIPVVLNFSCRDRNLLALKSDLLAAAATGIEAVVALAGDKLAPPAHGVHEVDAVGLLRVIEALNQGDTGDDRPLRVRPTLFAGAVANPNRADQDRELLLLARKARAGAHFAITQPIFDVRRAMSFIEAARAVPIKLVAGILPIRSARMARYLRNRVKALSALAGHFELYEGLSEEQCRRLSLAHSLETIAALRPYVDGFSIMSGGDPSLAIEVALQSTGQSSENAAV